MALSLEGIWRGSAFSESLSERRTFYDVAIMVLPEKHLQISLFES